MTSIKLTLACMVAASLWGPAPQAAPVPLHDEPAASAKEQSTANQTARAHEGPPHDTGGVTADWGADPWAYLAAPEEVESIATSPRSSVPAPLSVSTGSSAGEKAGEKAVNPVSVQVDDGGLRKASGARFGCEGIPCLRLHRLGISAVVLGTAAVVTGAMLWSRPPEPIADRPGVGYSTQPVGISAAVLGSTVLISGAMMLVIGSRASKRGRSRPRVAPNHDSSRP